MQTFLPYASFIQSAQTLDNRRLNKQIIEVKQILNAIDDPSYGWQHHPAVNMWRNYRPYLAEYCLCCLTEYQQRGFKVNPKMGEDLLTIAFGVVFNECHLPPFLGHEPFHTSHQCNLLRKAPIYYSKYFQHPLYSLVPYIWWSESKGFYTIKK